MYMGSIEDNYLTNDMYRGLDVDCFDGHTSIDASVKFAVDGNSRRIVFPKCRNLTELADLWENYCDLKGIDPDSITKIEEFDIN